MVRKVRDFDDASSMNSYQTTMIMRQTQKDDESDEIIRKDDKPAVEVLHVQTPNFEQKNDEKSRESDMVNGVDLSYKLTLRQIIENIEDLIKLKNVIFDNSKKEEAKELVENIFINIPEEDEFAHIELVQEMDFKAPTYE